MKSGSSLFGTDGIRGFAFGEKINPVSCVKLAVAFSLLSMEWQEDGGQSVGLDAIRDSGLEPASGSGRGSILVACDTRESCVPIYHSIASGVTGSGLNLLDCGVMHVGALSAGIVSSKASGGIMISASHNEHNDNGLKFFNGKGEKISASDQARMLSFFDSLEDGWRLKFLGVGSIKKHPLHDEYIDLIKNSALLQQLKGVAKRHLRVVVDCANGATCNVISGVLELFPFTAIYISRSPNGKNINLGCGVTDTSALQNSVIEHNADIGICFDGDGDRLLVVDEKGVVVEGERLIAFLSEQLFPYGAGGSFSKSVVTTVASNSCLSKFLLDRGFAVFLSDVGDQAVFQKMRAEASFIGGEESGHIIVGSASSVSDGVFNAVLFLLLFSATGLQASVALALPAPTPYRKFNVDCSEIANLGQRPMLDRLQERYLDILRQRCGRDSKLLIRPSGTEPKIRVYMESENAEFMDSFAENLRDEISKIVQLC